MYVFVLNGENIDLAKNEVLSLANQDNYEIDERILLVNKKFDFERLAYTHKVLRLIKKLNNIEQLNNVNIDSNGSYSVRILRISENNNFDYDSAHLGSLIWDKVKNPKVDLTNADNKFEFLVTKNNIYLCKEVYSINKKSMKERNAQFRPGFHPSSMNSNFARCLVNLSGVKPKQTFLDPFCGVGGILIEAGVIGCKIIGYDLSEDMINKCKSNLEYYKIKNYSLGIKDALKLNLKTDVIVTDFPYGLHSSTHGAEIKKLYTEFLKRSKKLINKNGKVVVVMPSTVKINIDGFRKQKVILHRIHKGLTRKIIILSN